MVVGALMNRKTHLTMEENQSKILLNLCAVAQQDRATVS